MYFWKIDDLKQALNHGKMSEHDTFLYILIYVFFATVGMELGEYYSAESHNAWDHFNSLSGIIIPILGTIVAYRCNGGENGHHFAQRYFSISLVMNVRFLVFSLLIMFMFMFILVVSNYESLATTWWKVTVASVWHIALYWRIVKHIGEVAKGEKRGQLLFPSDRHT